jgi:hypothetical protein
MARGSRSDDYRLKSILNVLLSPFSDGHMEDVDVETKLYHVFDPGEHPIYKRRVLRALKIRGLWWLNESQWIKWLWHGHQENSVVKGELDHEMVMTERTVKAGTFAFVRERGDRIDIEAISRVFVKGRGGTCEWLTVTITRAEYKTLDTAFGPVDDGCKHEELKYDFTHRR